MVREEPGYSGYFATFLAHSAFLKTHGNCLFGCAFRILTALVLYLFYDIDHILGCFIIYQIFFFFDLLL